LIQIYAYAKKNLLNFWLFRYKFGAYLLPGIFLAIAQKNPIGKCASSSGVALTTGTKIFLALKI
ncbi:hypothetical protein CFT12S02847_09265, partial [Campylobacter fetus subsp. testudinum]